MNYLLDEVSIKINFELKKYLLAKVTLNWSNEFEVRYFRITKRANGSLWFQPPALKEFGYAKCFAVIELENWKRLEKRVIKQFIDEARKKVQEGIISTEFLKDITAFKEETISDKEMDEISRKLTNSHL